MVTGCGCHDPIVFGHQEACRLGLGPRSAGARTLDSERYRAEYDSLDALPGPPRELAADWHRTVRQLPTEVHDTIQALIRKLSRE